MGDHHAQSQPNKTAPLFDLPAAVGTPPQAQRRTAGCDDLMGRVMRSFQPTQSTATLTAAQIWRIR
jgi:hypothetical protein